MKPSLHENKGNNNEMLFAEIMEAWDCSYLEAFVAVSSDYDTLEETQNSIAKAITYQRLLKSLLPSAIDFMRKKYSDCDDADFILAEAQEMAEDQANTFVYEWDQVDDYENGNMTEAEKELVMFGK
jgi:hypothetical protein